MKTIIYAFFGMLIGSICLVAYYAIKDGFNKIFCNIEYESKKKEYNKDIKDLIKRFENVIEIKFEKFKSFYSISPEKYDFSDLKKQKYIYYFSKKDLKHYFLVFSYRDYKKVLKFYKQIQMQKENNRKKDWTMGYLNSVQDDINEVKKQAKSYVDESLEIVNKVKQERKSRCG